MVRRGEGEVGRGRWEGKGKEEWDGEGDSKVGGADSRAGGRSQLAGLGEEPTGWGGKERERKMEVCSIFS